MTKSYIWTFLCYPNMTYFFVENFLMHRLGTLVLVLELRDES